MIIYDSNTDLPLLNGELSEDYEVKAVAQVQSFPDNQRIFLQMQAQKDNCLIVYQSGNDYFYEKKNVSMFNSRPKYEFGQQNSSGAYYALPVSLKEELDKLAAGIMDKKAEALVYYGLPEGLMQRMKEDFQVLVNDFVYVTKTLASFQQMAVGLEIRNYLLDGGMGLYEKEGKIVAVVMSRMGFEYDILGQAGITENLSNAPFGQASDNGFAAVEMCEWSVPFISYLVSDKQDDIKTYMEFVASLQETSELKQQARQLKQQVMQYQLQKAQMEAMNNQAMWNAAFAQQQQQFAAMDRMSASLHQDLDNFHQNLNAQMQSNDARFNLGQSSMGETMDDRIQRMRHEATMGVETYERQDGSTVEYANQADRVFENNLDSAVHFGTHHYYDDYVPEGWHELKKK